MGTQPSIDLASSASIAHLAETISAAMLRAAAAHGDIPKISDAPESAVIVNPIITAGGWIYIVKNAASFGRINAGVGGTNISGG